MANRIVKRDDDLIHYYDSYSVEAVGVVSTEADKNKAISDLSTDELRKMIDRLRGEREAEEIIRSLRRSAGEKDTYENPAKIDTKTPINQLYHHGIPGQKWGIRRFQNPDGTRTAAGKKRDGNLDAEKSEDHVRSREHKKRATEGLSNEELRKLNERLQLEATYKNLTTEKIQKSESFVKSSLKNAGSQALTEFSKSVFLGSAKLLVKNISPEFAEAAFNIKEKKKD